MFLFIYKRRTSEYHSAAQRNRRACRRNGFVIHFNSQKTILSAETLCQFSILVNIIKYLKD